MADACTVETQRTLVLVAKAPDMAIAMHRLFNIVAVKSRIPQHLRTHSAWELRQEREEYELCQKIRGVLEHGVPAPRVATMIDETPGISKECRDIFKHWVDVAAVMRAETEEPPVKARRLTKSHERGE